MRNLFRTFHSLLFPPPSPPTTSITADDFATILTDKTKTISSQFSPPHTQDLQPTTSTAQTPIFSFCPLTEAEVSKLLLSSHPTTCPLDPIPSHLLQAISPALLPALTHIINTSLLTGIFPTAFKVQGFFISSFKQARVTPLLKKPTLNTSLLENYRPVSLLPFIAKTLERVVFNQVSLFLSQNNKLDAKQSGFRSGHSTETALLSVTEALRIAKADSKSSVLILLDLSAAFDTVNHQILLSTLSSLDITGIPLRWFESYLTERGGIHSTLTSHWISSWTPPLLHIHYITGSHQTGIWLLLPLLRWWHTALSFFSTRWSNGSCTHLRLPGGHLGMDERKSPTAQPGKDFPATPALQHDFTIQLGSSTITPSTSVRNLGIIFDDQLTFKDHIAKTVSITQHQKDQACCTTYCPGPCHFKARLLQCSPGWTSIKHNQISTNDSECSGTTGLQRAQKSPCYTSLCLLALATRHWCLHIEQPQAQHPPTSTHYYESTSLPEVWDLLVSDASWYHHREAQNHSPEHSLSPFLAGGMIFPPPSRTLDPCQPSSNNWKLISFDTFLTSS